MRALHSNNKTLERNFNYSYRARIQELLIFKFFDCFWYWHCLFITHTWQLIKPNSHQFASIIKPFHYQFHAFVYIVHACTNMLESCEYFQMLRHKYCNRNKFTINITLNYIAIISVHKQFGCQQALRHYAKESDSSCLIRFLGEYLKKIVIRWKSSSIFINLTPDS